MPLLGLKLSKSGKKNDLLTLVLEAPSDAYNNLTFLRISPYGSTKTSQQLSKTKPKKTQSFSIKVKKTKTKSGKSGQDSNPREERT